jgi:methylase of polypeptide subunit release factors
LKFIHVIIKYTPYLLRDGACLMMEFGDGQAETVKQSALAVQTFSEIEIFKDLAGRDRVFYGKICHRGRQAA